LVCRRYVITVHDLVPHDRHTQLNRLLFAVAYRTADRLVVHTPRMRDELVHRYNVDAQRIAVMEHGLEPLNRAAPLRSGYKPGEQLRLLFFGYVMRYKGLDLLLKALVDFPHPFTLAIAGVCRDMALLAELQAQIATHPQKADIVWPNEYVNEDDIERLFVESHVLVMPYRHIDQSGVLFQALRFGLPVVATRVGALAQYVSGEIGEISDPESHQALRESLVRLVTRYEGVDRLQIVEIGRRFEWQNTVRVLPAVYA
jgi:glycosyltransferase involved in cell wall biosynthesis